MVKGTQLTLTKKTIKSYLKINLVTMYYDFFTVIYKRCLILVFLSFILSCVSPRLRKAWDCFFGVGGSKIKTTEVKDNKPICVITMFVVSSFQQDASTQETGNGGWKASETLSMVDRVGMKAVMDTEINAASKTVVDAVWEYTTNAAVNIVTKFCNQSC